MESLKTWAEPTMGKDGELFGGDLKSVNNTEEGLSPPGHGKTTTSMFLEQIDDITAYPRQPNHKNF